MLRSNKIYAAFAQGLFISIVVTLFNSALAGERGALSGGAPHQIPDWFKDSFLELADDVEEAGDADKHVMLFFQLNDCPYCDRMLVESFENDPYKSFIQTHFDVISINVRGDRDVVFNEELEMTEKELSQALNVFATPAIIFLNSSNKQIVRVNGHRAPERFQKTLNYVSSKAYSDVTFPEYVKLHSTEAVYTLRDHRVFSDIDNLSSVQKPLMLIFENKNCYECAEFHERLLSRKDIVDEMNNFTVVRLDTDSDNILTGTDGVTSTASALADKYNMTFRPGVLLFDDGELVGRNDSLLYSYHFREGLRYISGGFYKTEDRRSYSQRRREELLNAGVDIDLSE